MASHAWDDKRGARLDVWAIAGDRRMCDASMVALGGQVRASVVIAAVAIVLALPGTASATDYCVAPNTTCGGTNVADFQTALTLAGALTDSDRIFLGAATYTAPTTGGFSYVHLFSPVQVIGAGTGQTTLTAPSSATNVLSLNGGANSTVSDLTVHLPASFAASNAGLTIFAPASNIAVDADSTQPNPVWGIRVLNAGTVTDSTATLPTSGSGPNFIGVLIDGGTTDPVPLTRSKLTARTAVAVSSGTTATALERLELTGQNGVEDDGRPATVRDALIHVTQNQGAGLITLDQPTFDASLTGDGVTVIDEGALNTVGAAA